MKNQFLQIHTLTSYPGVLLNRDDAGFAKRLSFGGTNRTRVSSQCLKRHWRTFDGENSFAEIEVPKTIRSRRTFEEKVAKPLVIDGYNEFAVTMIVKGLMDVVLGKSSKRAKTDDLTSLQSSQVTVFGEPELEYFKSLTKELLEQEQESLPEGNEELNKEQQKTLQASLKDFLKDRAFKKNLKGIHLGAGLSAALFGRMVTGDVLSRCDAAIHVAHAITVHGEEAESDYFSVVDDLLVESGELGAGHINHVELTSGLFYSYVVIDLPLLVSNLEGCNRGDWLEEDMTIARKIVESIIHMIATVSPGAKLGSTAPYGYAQFMMTELGSAQPRSLANAFHHAVSLDGKEHVLAQSYKALAEHVGGMDEMYGRKFERWISGMPQAHKEQLLKASSAKSLSIPDMAKEVSQAFGIVKAVV